MRSFFRIYIDRKSILSFALLVVVSVAHAQESPLDRYVREGLAQNLTLQQQTFDFNQSQFAVSEARGRFMPNAGIDARYSRAGGGRTIDFPVGQLLNPVYGTLNNMLESQGQPGSFPTIADEQINFLREREQETKLRIVQPLFQPALRHNLRIQSSLSEAQGAAVGSSKREVVAGVKTAYFNYLKAEQVVDIFSATEALVAENRRVNERLHANGKVTIDAVYRAETEVLAVAQQKAEAEKNRDLAISYFNFLLNRPLDTPIEQMPHEDLFPQADTPVLLPASLELNSGDDHEHLAAHALTTRDELTQLASSLDAARANINLTQSAYLPNVSFVFDYGIQGNTYNFGNDADFWMGSVVMQWNLFDGFQKRARRQQARLQRDKLEAQREEAQQHIRLQVQEAYDNMAVARKSIQTAEQRLQSSRQTFRLVARKYQEGMTNQVEFIDARTELTNAELNLAITQYDWLTRQAELERAAALYPIGS